jgi:hypothetical protein
MNSRSAEKSSKILLSDQSFDYKNGVGNLSTSPLNSSSEVHQRFVLDNKIYYLFAITLSVFYFIDVFVGMLLIHDEYLTNSLQYALNEENYKMTSRAYDIIEVILLGIIVLDDIAKIVYTVRFMKKVII